MSVSTATVAQLSAVSFAVQKLNQMIREYNQGGAAPAVSPGRYLIADIDAQVLVALTALNALPGFSGQGLPATAVVVNNGGNVIVYDHAGTVNAKSPAVATVAGGVLTKATLAA